MSATVIGIFKSTAQARKAEQRLISDGFPAERIDVSTRTPAGTEDRTAAMGDGGMEGNGGAKMNGDAEASSREPGMMDKVSHFFKSLFSGDEADRYAEVGRRSEAIFTVHTVSPDESARASAILDDEGAEDVDELAAQYGAETSGNTSAYSGDGAGAYGARAGSSARLGEQTGSSTMPDAEIGSSAMSGDDTATVDQPRDRTEEATLNVIEENLQVGKRVVETGGARIRSRVVERPVEEAIRLREERVWVEHTPVNRVASASDLQAFQEGEVEMVERAEVPVVAKEARIVEEVSVNKESTERTETIRDTVRETEVDVEQVPGSDRVAGAEAARTSPTTSPGHPQRR